MAVKSASEPKSSLSAVNLMSIPRLSAAGTVIPWLKLSADEPGEAVALDAGWLSATVLDIVQADRPVAILNVSVTCHMPDVLEMPYRPPLFYLDAYGVQEACEEETDGYCYRLAGHSCLAGDVIPYLYSFRRKLHVGDRLLFGDMAIYTMVKTTTFNGLRHPSIARFIDNKVSVIRSFGYEDFKSRLS